MLHRNNNSEVSLLSKHSYFKQQRSSGPSVFAPDELPIFTTTRKLQLLLSYHRSIATFLYQCQSFILISKSFLPKTIFGTEQVLMIQIHEIKILHSICNRWYNRPGLPFSQFLIPIRSTFAFKLELLRSMSAIQLALNDITKHAFLRQKFVKNILSSTKVFDA